MTDARLRAMERAAAMGDQRAAEEAERLRERAGLVCEIHVTASCEVCAALRADPSLPLPGEAVDHWLVVLDLQRVGDAGLRVVVARKRWLAESLISVKPVDHLRVLASGPADSASGWWLRPAYSYRWSTGTVHGVTTRDTYGSARLLMDTWCGRIIAAPVRAARHAPPWDRSAVTCRTCLRSAPPPVEPLAVPVLRRWTREQERGGLPVYVLDREGLLRAARRLRRG